ncbi:hypothetical protein [Actinokineospora bangkokensis]|nr:hypothetical protein [Actinokineospora bangkokensis]
MHRFLSAIAIAAAAVGTPAAAAALSADHEQIATGVSATVYVPEQGEPHTLGLFWPCSP